MDLAELDRIFRARKSAELMAMGVTIYLPETVVIDPDVIAGPDTLIEPGVQLLGKTRIGERCKILTGSILRDVRVDDDAVVGPHSLLDSSRVGSEGSGRPICAAAPGSDVRAGAHVGNFVELKKTVLREGAKANHLSYPGRCDHRPRIQYRRGHNYVQL